MGKEKAPAAMPLFGDAYLADTMHLTNEEHGVYLKMLIVAWRQPSCSLPDDDGVLARIAGVGIKKWRSALRPVMMEFWQRDEDGRLFQKRLTRERSYVNGVRQQQSERADQRWGNGEPNDDRPAHKKRSERLTEARAKGRHTAAEWETFLEITGHKCLKCGATENLVKDHIIPIYQGGSDSLRNLQSLCSQCNSGKGPERSDYRLSLSKDVIECLRKRLPKCLPNACPSSSSSTYEEKTGETGARARTREGKPDLNSIVKAWNDMASANGLARVATLTDKRKGHLATRLKHHPPDKIIESIKAIPSRPFLKGSRGWKATFDWLIERPDSIQRILEGHYTEAPRGSGSRYDEQFRDPLFEHYRNGGDPELGEPD